MSEDLGRVIGKDGNEYDAVIEPNTKQKCYIIDEIYHHAENHLVVGTRATLFPLLRMAKVVGSHACSKKVRETTGLPYEDHLTEVYRLCSHYKFSHGQDAIYAAAFLHDYLEDAVKRNEDQKTTKEWMYSTFGVTVTNLVTELTNAEKNSDGLYPKIDGATTEWVEKTEYINWKLANMSSEALFLKLLDMLSNLGDANTMPKLFRRVRNHVDYIDKNKDTLFRHNMTPDHDLVISKIRRMLYSIYGV